MLKLATLVPVMQKAALQSVHVIVLLEELLTVKYHPKKKLHVSSVL